MAIELMSIMLPFVFMLAIVYGALDLAAVFNKKAVNVIIVSAMPYAAMLFIALFFIKFILSMFKPGKDGRDYTLLMVILGLIVIFMLSQGTELIKDWLPGGFPVAEDSLIIIIGIVVVLALVFAAYKNSEGSGTSAIK